jgi:hypothetical protein
MSTADLALDVGSLATKLALGRPGEPAQCCQRVTDADDLAGFLDGILASARDRVGGAIGQIQFAVPEAWLDGSEAGARRQEELRRMAEEQLGWGPVGWVGQASAVAALAAAGQRHRSARGQILVCDVGGQGVRVTMCEVADRAVRPIAARAAAGGGWREFDAAIRALVAADGGELPHDWYDAARKQAGRAQLLLVDEAGNPDFANTGVYRIDPANRRYGLTAQRLTEYFAATDRLLRAGIAAVLGAGTPTAAVATGGLAWFPLVARTITAETGILPEVIGPEAAAKGALLLGRGEFQLTWPDPPTVRLPMHQIVYGQLEDVRLPLPWTSAFADLDHPLILDRPELTLEVGGSLRTARMPDVVPGPYRIGLRRSWSGLGLLLLRANEPSSGEDVHVCSLDHLELVR